MAGLRSLLDKYDQITNTDINTGAVTPTYWTGEQWTHSSYCSSQVGCCDAYQRGRISAWCVPAGTSKITWHVWGAGASGAGGCCCMQGVPGGSGAYAKKKMTSVTPGDCYVMCAGWNGHCCTWTCRGCRGCMSYVTGNGLSNFCADGGYGGKACCFAYWRIPCSGQQCGYWYMDNCSERAQYYGADEGACGNAGFVYNYCGCNDNSCWWRQAVPYPGGITNKLGGWVHARTQGNACINDWTSCTAGGMSGHGASEMVGSPGMGGVSATSCGGGCCHSWSGMAWGPGLVKIDYC